ncbi:C-signal [Auricularia subglabra TFB-10046 SS5]|uniref:C-signal n=1 Tax=Auricularia subglabra (strain TFB-10046 / SS5) TaxID=717982 RepID=J0LC92_AURST|nr:C-signal [Auricularia subglabra TFB-10046 SS5]
MPVWFITGTSRGIGLELARQLAATSGNTVIATCRNPAGAAALSQIAGVHVVALDITSEESVRAAFAKTEAILGADGGIDYLINNAGIGGGDTVEDTTPEELHRQLTTHVVGPLLVFRAFLPLVRKGSRKVVVNVTSGLASIGLDLGPKGASYSIAKAGMNMLTYKMSKQYSDLTIFLLDPGWVKTDMGGPDAWLDVDYAVRNHIKIYESATLETHSGKFLSNEGKEIPW